MSDKIDSIMLFSASSEDTAAIGAAMGALLERGDVVLLTGDLGAGKSVIARGLARGVGVQGNMPSPTFTLMQPYMGRIPFYHFDLYRLEDEDEFYAAGLDEYIGGDGAAAVEWPDRAAITADSLIGINIERAEGDDEARDITVTLSLTPGRASAIKNVLAPWRQK